MGARGSGSFENDTASDWAFGLEGVNDTSLIESTLEKVIGVGAEYLQAPDAEEGLAAAETVARMKGQWGARNSYTEPMDRWVERLNWRPSSELVRKAVVVVDRILSEPSELLELWTESEEYDAWKASLSNLRQTWRLAVRFSGRASRAAERDRSALWTDV